MTVLQVRDEIDSFFANWGGASLKLPSGWFGRPYDSFHELTSLSVVDGSLVIVLDERQKLTLHHPREARVAESVLFVNGFDLVEWSWYAYDTGAEHHERFTDGAIEFVAA